MARGNKKTIPRDMFIKYVAAMAVYHFPDMTYSEFYDIFLNIIDGEYSDRDRTDRE